MENKQENNKSSKINHKYIIYVILLIVIVGFSFKYKQELLNLLKDYSSLKQQEIKSESPAENLAKDEEQQIEEILSVNVANSNITSCGDLKKLINAVVHIMQKIESGESYAADIGYINAIHNLPKKAIKNLAFLDASLDKNIPTFSSLLEDYNNLGRAVIIKNDIEKAENNVQRFIYKIIYNFVFIRKMGDRALETGGVEEILMKAEAALLKLDIENAIEELKALKESDKKVMDPWVQSAQDYLQVRKSARDLYDFIMQELDCSFDNALEN